MMGNPKNLYGYEEGMYTLLNREYFNIAGALHEALKEQDVKYAVVGGGGIQARIVDAVAKQGLKSIKDCKHILQTPLRSTTDIDIATSGGDGVKMFSAGQKISGSCGVGYNQMRDARALKFEPVGKAPIYVQYELDKDNFQGLPEMYNSVIEEAEKLNLRYNGKHGIELMVAQPKHLIASKLTRWAPKDIVDTSNLLKIYHDCGKQIDIEDIRAILKGSNKGNLFERLERICLDLGISK